MSKKKIGDIGEFGFINSIEKGCHFDPQRVIKGIGDDCAVIGPYDKRVLLITTDLMVEGTHFLMDKIPPEHLGQKAAAVSLSDIAAMGGTARHLFVSMAIPALAKMDTLHAVYRGIKSVCRHFGVNILGGDTSLSKKGLLIDITAIGEADEKEVLYRDGATPDDEIYVTGTLGDSAAGLKLITGEIESNESSTSVLIEAHNRPFPFLEAGGMIAESGLASAMIDLSDGLFSDLGHICEASGTGAVIFYNALPISPQLAALADACRLNPRDLALYGGEDYRLLITVPRTHADTFQGLFKHGSPCHVYRLGKITAEKGIRIITQDGREKVVRPEGFRHFLPL